MPKYFLNDFSMRQDGTISVKGPTAHHLLHVLRFKQGQTAVFCDGNGTDLHCIYEGHDNKKLTLFFSIQNELKSFNELPYKVTLYQSVINAGKMEVAIQKCVELGVNKIVPIYTKYSSVKFPDQELKNERFQKIAENAAEQSMRGYLPEITAPVRFEKLISTIKAESLWLVAYENERLTTITDAVKDSQATSLPFNKVPLCESGSAVSHTRSFEIGIWVGPEGGFAEEEIATLKETGAVTITLGRRILRAETAGPVILSQLQCALRAETF